MRSRVVLCVRIDNKSVQSTQKTVENNRNRTARDAIGSRTSVAIRIAASGVVLRKTVAPMIPSAVHPCARVRRRSSTNWMSTSAWYRSAGGCFRAYSSSSASARDIAALIAPTVSRAAVVAPPRDCSSAIVHA